MNYNEDLFYFIIMKICNIWLLLNSLKFIFFKFNKILIRYVIKVFLIILVFFFFFSMNENEKK